MKSCPNCKTPLEVDAPFCDHCGFRLRSQETALEGLPAISPALLKQEALRRPERVSTSEEPSISSIAQRARRQTDEEPAVPRPRQNTAKERLAVSASALRDAPVESSKTVMEGMQAIRAVPASPHAELAAPQTIAQLASIAQAAPQPAPRAHPADSSALLRAQRPASSRWLPALPIGLVSGALLGGLLTWLTTAPSLDDLDPEQLEPLPDERLAFGAASFKQGLNEQTRSIILRTCFKLSDTPDEECQQDTLLKGEYPQVQVEVAPFSLDANEVSHARYEACVKAGACAPLDYKACKVYTTQGLQIALRVPKALQRADRPVVCITHDQARALCAWSGGRLPTHAEWELAARGTRDARLFPWGETWDPTWANWGEQDLVKSAVAGKIDGYAWTSPSGRFQDGLSPFGVRDMAGNVAEWVERESDTIAHTRGGSWTSAPFELRVTRRVELSPDTARTDVGARCAY